MGTWAAVTRLDAPEAPPLVQTLDSANISVAVVDTNAIISGLQLHRIADTAVTIPEVLSEVRDKHTRQALANLPFALECKQPTEESVKAGKASALVSDFALVPQYSAVHHVLKSADTTQGATELDTVLSLQSCALRVRLGTSILFL